MLRWIVACSIVIVAAAGGRADDAARAAGPDPRVVEGLNRFAIDILRGLAPAGKAGNVVVSPDGAVRVLAMAAEGAAGETAAEIRRVGRLPATSRALEPIDPSRPISRPNLGARFAANGSYGVKVDHVPDRSAAARVGLAPGDLILAVNDRPTRSVARLSEAVEAGGEGPIRLQIYAFESGRVVEKSVEPDRSDSPSPFVHRDVAFLQRGLATRPEFRSALEASFRAQVVPIDFADDPLKGAAEIRRWAEMTAGAAPLPDLGALDASTRLVLVDAVTFEAEWLQPFPSEIPGRFTRGDGSVVPTPMFERIGRYAVDPAPDGSVAVEIPYADRSSALVVILPPAGRPVRDYLGAEDGKNGDPATRRASMKPMRSEVRLPHFRIAATNRLKEPLGRLGMRLAFGAGADFSNAVAIRAERDGPIGLAEVLQTATLEVTPRGTKADATTIATAVTLGVEDDPVAVHADRPFAFFLIDLRTGLIVFEGIVEDPSRPT